MRVSAEPLPLLEKEDGHTAPSMLMAHADSHGAAGHAQEKPMHGACTCRACAHAEHAGATRHIVTFIHAGVPSMHG